MTEGLRAKALEAIEWRLKYPDFKTLRTSMKNYEWAEETIQYFMERIEAGHNLTEEEWLVMRDVRVVKA